MSNTEVTDENLVREDGPTTPPEGLTAEQVAERVAAGQVNHVEESTSRTVKAIIKANVLTRFNGILVVLAAAVIATGRYGDAVFAVILVLNSLIGITQELRAKKTLDKLALMHSPTACVVRDGEMTKIPLGHVVLDDLVELRSGDQVPADGRLTSSNGLEIDESSLTGESDPVAKDVDDDVLSGTIVVAGKGHFQARAVGTEAYARKISVEVKTFTRVRSELQEGINTLLIYITWILLAVAPLLLWSQFRTNETGDWRDPVTGTAAALVGMVPEGLVLLTSISFLLAALSLTKRQVLVQELPAVEGLARVDVVCLDKTGTLTAGDITFDSLVPVDDDDRDRVASALAAMAAGADAGASVAAIGEEFDENPGWEENGSVSFSSARKWSASSYADHGSWYLGAPEMLLADGDPMADEVAPLAKLGKRVLAVQHTDSALSGDVLPDDRRSVALVTLKENVRPDAAETLRYFAEQGVIIKVISGDNAATVGAIAAEVGLEVGEPIDARTIGDTAEELLEVVEQSTVFGRVSPQQKRAMVQALQANGHTVAMTGDGVNDAMALKDADIGVAMGNGAQATKGVAQLVLLDSQFSRLPHVLGEGRRVIGNIERVASLFVTKNAYSLLLALLVTVVGLPYPFLPRHLTLISMVTIGIPAFVLALGPNTARYRPGFLRRVLLFAVPAGFITGAAIFFSYLLAQHRELQTDELRTAAAISALVVTLWILAVLARPFKWWKAVLVGSMSAIAAAAIIVPPVRSAFELQIPYKVLFNSLLIGAAGALAVELLGRWVANKNTETDLRRRPKVA